MSNSLQSPALISRAAAMRQPYFDVIGEALRGRGTRGDDFEQDARYGECRYVVRLCERLARIIHRPEVGLREVMRVERLASGHVDYQEKLALYCAELSARGASHETAARGAGAPPAPLPVLQESGPGSPQQLRESDIRPGRDVRRRPGGRGCRVMRLSDDRRKVLIRDANTSFWVSVSTLLSKWY